MTRPLPFTPEVSSKHWGGWTNDWGRWWGDCGSWGFGGCMNNLMPWGNWGCKPYWPGESALSFFSPSRGIAPRAPGNKQTSSRID
jgi:hypothetical protein